MRTFAILLAMFANSIALSPASAETGTSSKALISILNDTRVAAAIGEASIYSVKNLNNSQEPVYYIIYKIETPKGVKTCALVASAMNICEPYLSGQSRKCRPLVSFEESSVKCSSVGIPLDDRS